MSDLILTARIKRLREIAQGGHGSYVGAWIRLLARKGILISRLEHYGLLQGFLGMLDNPEEDLDAGQLRRVVRDPEYSLLMRLAESVDL